MKTKTLEQWFVELRILSIAVIAAVISITAKSSWYYYKTFSIEIPQAQAIAAIFFGVVTGLIVSLTSFHKNKDKKDYTSFIFFIANIILTALILNVFTSADPDEKEFIRHPATFYIERIFLSLFLPSLEYAAVNKWKQVFGKKKEGLQQTLSKLEQEISKEEQNKARVKQEISKLENDKKMSLEILGKLQQKERESFARIKQRTCHCGKEFDTIKALNGHKTHCKKKIENTPVTFEEVKPE